MPGDMGCFAALCDMRKQVRAQLLQNLGASDRARRIAKQLMVDLTEQPRVVVSLATEHHAIKGLQVLGTLLKGFDAAIEDDFQIWKISFELRCNVITQRRNIAVFFRR